MKITKTITKTTSIRLDIKEIKQIIEAHVRNVAAIADTDKVNVDIYYSEEDSDLDTYTDYHANVTVTSPNDTEIKEEYYGT
jgi:hypothetical protein